MGSNMFRFAATLCIAASVAATPALAQEPKAPSPAQAAQQQRMSTCNAAASQRNLKGEARQSYMSGCLAGDTSQTTLMKVCNDRKVYLSTCLKKSG